MVHQPVSRGLAVFADAWLSGWLAEISADLWETVAHQRWCHDDVLYKSTTLHIVYVLSFFCYLSNNKGHKVTSMGAGMFVKLHNCRSFCTYVHFAIFMLH